MRNSLRRIAQGFGLWVARQSGVQFPESLTANALKGYASHMDVSADGVHQRIITVLPDTGIVPVYKFDPVHDEFLARITYERHAWECEEFIYITRDYVFKRRESSERLLQGS